ncbi:MAG: PH domain-containing protein [Planctomycetales bacterium]|nr:PH domain-containing protein [Planctomycetales bacterium]
MKQAIAGVAPSELDEVTVMIVWPTITAVQTPPFGRLGCTLGRMYSIPYGIGPVLTVGNLLALLSIPLALLIFASSLAPFICRRYRLTNRRVTIEKLVLQLGRGWLPLAAPWVEDASVSLDNFDAIDIEVLKGQDWYPAGDLIFRKGAVETLRLPGVSRPETFRQTCLKAHQSHVGVKAAVART